MIKAIITDVDGVIVGTQEGINFPLPNEKIIQELKELNKRIPIILCTGKFSFAIEGIIRKAALDNPHITDGGALIYNPLQGKIIKEHGIPYDLKKKIIETCLQDNIYLELHGTKEYYVQKDQEYELTKKRTSILQKEPVFVASLLDALSELHIIKILAFVKDNSEKPRIEEILTPFTDEIHAIWSTVPFMLPAMARVITIKGVSKMHAAQEVMEYLGLSFDECLGVGDLPADWQFMKLCKYAAITGSTDEEFITNVKTKGEGNYFLAPSADEDGFLDAITYFSKEF